MPFTAPREGREAERDRRRGMSANKGGEGKWILTVGSVEGVNSG